MCMKKILFLSLFFLPAVKIAAQECRPAESLPARYTQEEKLYALSLLWSELKYNFVHVDRIGFDMDSLYRSYIPPVLRTENDVEYFDLMKRFVAHFDDGHTDIGDTSYRDSDVYDYLPVLFEEQNGRIYISRLWESSGLDSLALGAELIRIEGKPTQEYAAEHYFPYIAHGSARKKLSIAVSGMGMGMGQPGSMFCGRLKFRDGREADVRIARNFVANDRQGGNGRMWWWQGFRKRRSDRVTLEWLDGGIAWMDFRSFSMNSIPKIDTMMQQIRERAAGLIVDLRFCPRGSSPVVDHLLQYLVRSEYYLAGHCQTRISSGYRRAQGNWSREHEDFLLDRALETHPADTVWVDRDKALSCPVIILIDKFTASAAETFLVQLYEIPGRPRLLGRQTEGSTGAPLVVDLPHDAWARICTVRHLFPVSHEKFDGMGIMPDEIIEPTLDDFIGGYDRVLERAVELLRDHANASGPHDGCSKQD